MEDHVHLTTWISRDSKERFAAIAQAQGLSESALLRRLVESMLPPTGSPEDSIPSALDPVPLSGRISVRLRDDDLIVLRERATAAERRLPSRKMPANSRNSSLVGFRGHVARARMLLLAPNARAAMRWTA